MTTDDAAATQKAAADVLIRWVKAWGADDSDIRAFSDLQTRIAQAIRDAIADRSAEIAEIARAMCEYQPLAPCGNCRPCKLAARIAAGDTGEGS